jgi:hypothetical protein
LFLICFALLLSLPATARGGANETEVNTLTASVITENVQDSVTIGATDADTSRVFFLGGSRHIGFFCRYDNRADSINVIVYLDVAPADQDERSIYGTFYTQVDSLSQVLLSGTADVTVYKSVSATIPIWARYGRLRVVGAMVAADTVKVTTKLTKVYLGAGGL